MSLTPRDTRGKEQSGRRERDEEFPFPADQGGGSRRCKVPIHNWYACEQTAAMTVAMVAAQVGAK